MGTAKWIYCPICKNKTRTKIRTDTKLINFPFSTVLSKMQTGKPN